MEVLSNISRLLWHYKTFQGVWYVEICARISFEQLQQFYSRDYYYEMRKKRGKGKEKISGL